MKHIHYLYHLLCLSLFGLLSACSQESEMPSDNPEHPQGSSSLIIRLGTESPNSDNAPNGVNGDRLALEGEFINTLCVFIVNEKDVVEAKLKPDLTNDPKASEGNLSSWTSDVLQITDGEKTIYAFANCEGLIDDISNIEVNGAFQNMDTKTISWDKGSDWKPGPDKGFIPMSAKETLNISGATTKTIYLTRLLSRLEVSFQNLTEGEITISSWSIGEFNSQINLFGTDVIATMQKEWPIEQNQEIKLPAATEPSIPTIFYVPETHMAGGFKVRVTPKDKTEEKRTKRETLFRNHVWPLNILFGDQGLSLAIAYENPPIGGYPKEEKADFSIEGDPQTYTFTLNGGGGFTIAPTLKTAPNATWTVKEDTSSKLVRELKVNDDGKTITGIMNTSTIGDSYTFTLTASNGSSFNIKLIYADIFQNNNNKSNNL
ncbi:hypothetical protein [Parabacteroides sp.]